MKSPTDLDRFQDGESSQFNSSFATLERMHQELKEANYWSGYPSIQGVEMWLHSLRSFDRELSPFINKEEEEELRKVRVRRIVYKPKLVPRYQDKLDSYERELRRLHTVKGFGIKAGEGDPLERLKREIN